MKRFTIETLRTGEVPQIEIDEALYRKMIAEYEYLQSVRLAEEKYDILIDNYRELEHDCLEIALSDELYSNYDIPGFFAEIRQLSRRVANILSASRLFLDSLDRELKTGSQKNYEEINNLRSSFYDDQPDYRLFEALRNYAQHKGLPFSIRKNASALDMDNHRYIVFNTSVLLQIQELKNDKKVPLVVRQDLEAYQKESVEINESIRNYIGMISRIHEKARELRSTATDAAIHTITGKIDEYASLDEAFKKSAQRILSLCEYIDEKRITQNSYEITYNVIADIKSLQNKNKVIRNLSSRATIGLSDNVLKIIQMKLRNS